MSEQVCIRGWSDASSNMNRRHFVRAMVACLGAGHLASRAALAAEARVGTLVLSHLIPAEDPAVTDEMWTAAARTHFGGHVIVAKDLMEL